MALTFKCSRGCSRYDAPEPRELAEQQTGAKWWAPASLELMQAEIVYALCRRGYCDRHAALFGAMTAAAVREESARRAALPGTVEVRRVKLEPDAGEAMTAAAAKRDGDPIVDRVRKFVIGSQLSALVELDVAARRARVTLRMSSSDREQPQTVIDSDRLVHTTPAEIADALRRAQAR